MSGKHQRDAERERFWREAVAAWKNSGLSVRAFCAGRGLQEPSFYCWRRTLQRRDAQRPAARPKLVPVRVVADALVEIVLPTGLVVRVPAGTDAATVSTLVAALRAAAC